MRALPTAIGALAGVLALMAAGVILSNDGADRIPARPLPDTTSYPPTTTQLPMTTTDGATIEAPAFFVISHGPGIPRGEMVNFDVYTDYEGHSPEVHWDVTDAAGNLVSSATGEDVDLVLPTSGTAIVKARLLDEGREVASATSYLSKQKTEAVVDLPCVPEAEPHECSAFEFEVPAGTFLFDVSAALGSGSELTGRLLLFDPAGEIRTIVPRPDFRPQFDLWFFAASTHQSPALDAGPWRAVLTLDQEDHDGTVTWQYKTFGSGRLLAPDAHPAGVWSEGVQPRIVEAPQIQISAQPLYGFTLVNPVFLDAFTGLAEAPAADSVFEWTVRDVNGTVVATGTGRHLRWAPQEPGPHSVAVVLTHANGTQLARADATIGISRIWAMHFTCAPGPSLEPCTALRPWVPPGASYVMIQGSPYGPLDPALPGPPVGLGEAYGTLSFSDPEGDLILEGEEARGSRGSWWWASTDIYQPVAGGEWSLSWTPGPAGGFPKGFYALHVAYPQSGDLYADILTLFTSRNRANLARNARAWRAQRTRRSTPAPRPQAAMQHSRHSR